MRYEINYKTAILNAVSNSETFLRLTLSHPRRGTTCNKIAVRLVQIKNAPHLQIARYSRTQDITENIPLTDTNTALDELLALPFAQIHVQNSHEDLHIRITKKGRALFKRAKPSRPNIQPALSHNRVKHHPLSDNRPERLSPGTRHHGSKRARASIHARQISKQNQRLSPPLTTRHTNIGSPPHPHRLRLRQRVSHICSVSLPEQHPEQPRATHSASTTTHPSSPNVAPSPMTSGWTDLAFHNSSIADFTPQTPPDIVFSLHACDTATDDAIARAVQWNSPVILAAPCCQHELRPQLHGTCLLTRNGTRHPQRGAPPTSSPTPAAHNSCGYWATAPNS